MKSQSISLIGVCVWLTLAPVARAGTVTGVAASQRTIVAGATITVKVNGTNPCGAAHIIYGDGDAITYAITGLPVEQTHVYQKAGNYTITAKGMGNCDGDATTTLTVFAPPEPPPSARPRASITAVEILPTPGRVQEPIAVVTSGTGNCAYEVQYGDGTSEQVNARLPEDTHHTYTKAGRYVVIVRPSPPCVGKFTQAVQVMEGAAAEPARTRRITRVSAGPTPAAPREPVTIMVDGAGTCAVSIDYGDGNTDSKSLTLPESLRHVYSAPGTYTVIVASAAEGCTGSGRVTVEVRRSRYREEVQ